MLNLHNIILFSEQIGKTDGDVVTDVLAATYSSTLQMISACLLWIAGNIRDSGKFLPQESIKAIHDLTAAGNVHFWCQNGFQRVGGDGKVSDLLSLVDKVIHPIELGQNSSFHPKIMLMRYLSKDKHNNKDIRFKLIILSRNLVASKDFDILFAIEASISGSQTPEGRELSEFFVSFGHRLIRRDLMEEIRKMKFIMQGELANKLTKRPRFLWQSPGDQKKRRLIEYFPRNYETAFVISPFLDWSIIKEIINRSVKKKIRILSSRDALDKLFRSKDCDDITWEQQIEAYVVEDETVDNDQDVSSTVHDNQDIQYHQLHAKAFFFQTESGSILYIGSANATSRGLRGKNTECLIRLDVGTKTVDEFWEESFTYRKGGEQLSYFKKYSPSGDSVDDCEKRIVDSIHMLLRQINVEMRRTGKQSFSLCLTGIPESLKSILLKRNGKVLFSPWHYRMKSQEGMDLLSFTNTEEFLVDDISDLSPFIFFEIYVNGKRKKEFILMASVEDQQLWDEKLSFLMHRYLASHKDFFIYLSMLFGDTSMDPDAEGYDDVPASERNGAIDVTRWAQPEKLFSLEDILKCVSCDRSVLDRIDQFLNLFKRGGKPTDDKISTFIDTWTAISSSLRGGERMDESKEVPV